MRNNHRDINVKTKQQNKQNHDNILNIIIKNKK